jgi:hypothetical protein
MRMESDEPTAVSYQPYEDDVANRGPEQAAEL